MNEYQAGKDIGKINEQLHSLQSQLYRLSEIVEKMNKEDEE